MKVKICGIMRSSDLKSLEKFDPHFIGFINIKRSKRFVDIAKINSLLVYPNPFNRSTRLSFNNPEGYPYSLYIMDITGKVCRIVDKITTSEYVLEKRDLKEGFYFVELNGPKIYRGKIMVE